MIDVENGACCGSCSVRLEDRPCKDYLGFVFIKIRQGVNGRKYTVTVFKQRLAAFARAANDQLARAAGFGGRLCLTSREDDQYK